jgi:hypothetical protein
MSYSFWRMEMAILIWGLWFDQIEVLKAFLEIRKVQGLQWTRHPLVAV